MKTKIVSYTPETLPQLTEARLRSWKAFLKKTDRKIDTSDIPEITDEQIKNAVRGRFYRAPKETK
jgi:hypothetical protein